MANAAKVCLFAIGYGLIAFGLIWLCIGLLYVLGGATVADPGPILIKIGLRRVAVGAICLGVGVCSALVATELRRR